MPRLPIDYQKCVMYKIVCSDINVTEIYVGHTTDFIRRKQQHKTCCNNENSIKYNYKVYDFIRENGGFENWSMIEIEKFSCLDTYEATARERYWVEFLKPTLNSYIPSKTTTEKIEYKKEYAQANSTKIKERQKNYRANNVAKLKENIECACGGHYKHNDKSQHLKTKKHMSYCSQIN
jgi:hypothetical protein